MSRIFISYANVDGGDAAQTLAAALEAGNQPCWIAPRNVLPGVPYPGQIVRAVKESCGLVLLSTPGANQSNSVLSEVELAYNEKKIIAALIVRGTEPSDDLRFFLSVRHRIAWSDAKVVAAALGQLFAPMSTKGAVRESPSVALEPRQSETFRDGPDCPEMVMIPPGSFLMGSPDGEEGRSDTEGPGNLMSHIFISHSSRDGRDPAERLVAELEATGRACWIAPRNMKPAAPFPEQIVTAISDSLGLVLLLTPEANQSLDVLQEVVQAHHERKLIAAVTFSGTEPSKNLIYYLRVRQQLVWTDARAVAAALGQVFAPMGTKGAPKESPSVTRQPRYGESFRDWPEGPELVMIPPGSFMMGSPNGEEGRSDDEGPVHQVTIGYPFAVGKYPVTRGDWRQFVQATGHKSDRWLNPGFPQEDSHPVVNISWQDAADYATWLRQKTRHVYRLLSEAEYEYVNRAGRQTAYFWGEKAADMRLYTQLRSDDLELYGTWPVGRFKSNAFGLHDTSGHVWCWTRDRWHSNYLGAPADGSAWEEGTYAGRVVRGGSWFSSPRYLRSAYRYGLGLDDFNFVGFRVARTAA